jgi:hypothetical protein
MTATSLAKAGPTDAGVEDFALREAREWRLEVLRRGMNFPEVKMKVLLYGEREGFTSGGNGGIGGVVRRMGHPQGQLGVGLMEIAPTAQPGISLPRKAGRECNTKAMKRGTKNAAPRGAGRRLVRGLRGSRPETFPGQERQRPDCRPTTNNARTALLQIGLYDRASRERNTIGPAWKTG